MITQTSEELLRENAELRRRLEEAEEAIRAIRAGEVDAVLIEAEREQVYTLESADKPYRLLVEQMPQGAATLTAEGAVIYCNRRFADLLQRPLSALLGKPIQEFVAADSRPFFESLLRDVKAGEVQGEVTLTRADGAPAPAYLGVSALQEGALGLCLMVTDLSEQRHYQELSRAQEALRESEAALKDADRKKDEFVATVAHELRNPLAPIRNALQILTAKGPPDPELQWARGVIGRQVRLMSRLLDDLLDVSRISRRQVELRKERVELAALVEAALETSRPLLEAAGHALTVALPPAPIHLEADPVRMAQVFANLLNNAAKYTEPGGRIGLTAERQGGDVVVSVKDDGMGIAPEMLPRVFQIFAQANRALVRSQGGLGIGLSLVKGMVELHGGGVEARSEGLGRGSEFRVRLPAAAQTPAPERPRGEAGEPGPAARRRILVVDDNRDSADSLAMLLKFMGHEVGTAYDGEQAVEAAGALRPDVALLDIGMPRLDGYAACRRIREQPWGRPMFLIALTGWGQEEDRRRTEAAGFDHHMLKPVDPAELLKLLASLPWEQGGRPAKR
jgi:PAS domain S-box-containing protein